MTGRLLKQCSIECLIGSDCVILSVDVDGNSKNIVNLNYLSNIFFTYKKYTKENLQNGKSQNLALKS